MACWLVDCAYPIRSDSHVTGIVLSFAGTSSQVHLDNSSEPNDEDQGIDSDIKQTAKENKRKTKGVKPKKVRGGKKFLRSAVKTNVKQVRGNPTN